MATLKSLSDNPSYENLVQELNAPSERNNSNNSGSNETDPPASTESRKRTVGWTMIARDCNNSQCGTKLFRNQTGEIRCLVCLTEQPEEPLSLSEAKSTVQEVHDTHESHDAQDATHEEGEGDETDDSTAKLENPISVDRVLVGWTRLSASCPVCMNPLARIGDGIPICFSCRDGESKDSTRASLADNHTGVLKRSISGADLTAKKKKTKTKDISAPSTPDTVRPRHYVRRAPNPTQQAINEAFGGGSRAGAVKSSTVKRRKNRTQHARKLTAQPVASISEIENMTQHFANAVTLEHAEPVEEKLPFSNSEQSGQNQYETILEQRLDPLAGANHALVAKMEWSRQQLESCEDISRCTQLSHLIASLATAITSIKNLQKP